MSGVDVSKTFVQYARDTGKIILSVLDAGSLPDGAQWDPEYAEAVASDAALLAASRDYWRACLNRWCLRVETLASALPPAFSFGHSAAGDGVKQALQRRKTLQNEANYCANNPRCNRSPRPQFFSLNPTCMVALDEIATQASLAIGGYPESQMWIDLQAFLQSTGAARNDNERLSIANGIRAARELDDLGRRFDIASAAAFAFNALNAPADGAWSFTEFLALHRQEGAMCLTPSTDSFPHGPLVLTEPGDCRTPSITLNAVVPWRPGFNLAFNIADTVAFLGGDLSGTDLGSRLIMTKINLLALGGLDNLVSWPLHDDDELAQLAKPLATSASTNLDWPGINQIEKNERTSMVMGLLMADLENEDQPGSFGDQFHTSYEDFVELVRAHRVETNPKVICLLEDDERTSTARCLRYAAQWYATRSRPATLAARRDRAAFQALPRFSPFVTYVRYHVGDVLFMGVLIRLLNEFCQEADVLSDAVAQNAPDFAQFAANDPDGLAALSDNFSGHLLPFWRGVAIEKDDSKSVWRHIGLAQAMGASLPRPVQARSSAMADVVRQVMQPILQYNLIGAINAALEFTPISKLMGLASFDDQRRRTDFAVAENFTRMQLCFEAARQEAMLSYLGTPV